MQDIECRFARRVVVAQQSRQRTERALLVKMDKQVLLPRYLLEPCEAYPLGGRTRRSMTEPEVTQLLTAMNDAARMVKPRRLGRRGPAAFT
jgi:hypothetical protein